MKIRKATLKDLKTIVNLWVEFMKEHDKNVLKENERLDFFIKRKDNSKEIFSEFVEKNIKSKNSEIFLAEVENQIVGFCQMLIKDEIPVFKIEKYGYISDLFVKKEYRKKGISTKLKDMAFDWFREKGMKFVSLGMYPDNIESHEIYKKWGFFDYHVDMRIKL